jgi:hypothetical protein
LIEASSFWHTHGVESAASARHRGFSTTHFSIIDKTTRGSNQAFFIGMTITTAL